MKERRRQWAQKLTPRSLPKEESTKDETENETLEESLGNKGMLPDDIVKLLAEREKYVCLPCMTSLLSLDACLYASIMLL